MDEMDQVDARIAKALKMLKPPWYERRWFSIALGVGIGMALAWFFWWALNYPPLPF